MPLAAYDGGGATTIINTTTGCRRHRIKMMPLRYRRQSLVRTLKFIHFGYFPFHGHIETVNYFFLLQLLLLTNNGCLR